MVGVDIWAGRGRTVITIVDDDVAAAVMARSWRLHKGYVVTRVYAGKRRGRSVHRDLSLARWLMGLKRGDVRVVDHINRDPLDNRRSNLRVCSRAQNAQNRGPHRRTKHEDSGIRGVHWSPQAGKWIARVRKIVIGRYDSSELEAAAAAVRAAREAMMPYTVEGDAPSKGSDRQTAWRSGCQKFVRVKL